MKKLMVAVIFGGRSGEHEVSLVSATSVIKALDPEKYEVVEIGISKDGQWMTGQNCLSSFKKEALQGLKFVPLSTNMPAGKLILSPSSGKDSQIDIVFPVLHGPYGEDGTIQGLLEMLNIPCVGSGVLASALAMDKLQCKMLLEAAGIPVVPYFGFTRSQWEKEPEKVQKTILRQIGLPCFVKPANLGSSVGISKVKKEGELKAAIDLAAKFDRRLIVEKAVNAREIECAVLGNEEPIAAPLGEIIVGGEFYDFEDKYVNSVSKGEVPANLNKKVAQDIQAMCLKAYKLLDCSGLARVDCFLDRDSGKIYLNELNTMPGFTSISMYPKMMAAHGISYEQLVDRLIQLGLEKFKDKQRNQISFDSGSDWYKKTA